MKKIAFLFFAMGFLAFAQAQTAAIDNTRRVSTKGYAEREVTPDIIYLSVSLREYYEDGNMKKKVPIQTLEQQLFVAANTNGIKKEDLTIQNIHSYNYDPKKKNSELLQARQYRIKVTDLSRLNAFFQQLDSRGIQNTSISEYDHSRKKEIEKELKTEAVKDARNNAEILAAADGQSVGKSLLLNDNSSFNWNDIMPSPRMYSMAVQQADASIGAGEAQQSLDISVRPIKLVSNVDAVFELQ